MSAHYGKEGKYWHRHLDEAGNWVKGQVDGVGNHRGIDYATKVGVLVSAVDDGVIEFAGWESEDDPSKGFGRYARQVVWMGDKKHLFYYAHLSHLHCAEGDRVRKGDAIGLTGDTGRSSGPHLHVELRNSNWVSQPILWEADIV